MTKTKIAYVTGTQTGKTEFEVHGAGCAHLKRLHPWAYVHTFEVDSIEGFIDSEVETYQAQDQGWTHKDFRVLPCAKGAK